MPRGRRGAVSALLFREDHAKGQEELARAVHAHAAERVRGSAASDGLHHVQLFTWDCHALCARDRRGQPGGGLLHTRPHLENSGQRERHRVQGPQAGAQERAVRAVAALDCQCAKRQKTYCAWTRSESDTNTVGHIRGDSVP